MKKFITAALAVAALIALTTASSVQAGSYDPLSFRSSAYVAPNRIAYTKQCGPNGCYNVPVRNTVAAYPYASNSTLNCANGQCPLANGQCTACANGQCASCPACANGRCAACPGCVNGQCSPCANGQCAKPNLYGSTYNRFNQARRANTHVIARQPAPVHHHTTRYTPPARSNRTLLNPLGLNLFFK